MKEKKTHQVKEECDSEVTDEIIYLKYVYIPKK